jgi:hypothetical protein
VLDTQKFATEPLEAIQRDLVPIFARYQGQLSVLNAQLQAELDLFRERLESLRQAVEELQETFSPNLPSRPEPEVDEPDETDWLFDAARDYMTQLRYYQARKATATEEAAD